MNIIGDFLALPRTGQAAKLGGIKSLIIGLDGMQPEKGNTYLYIGREIQTGLTLMTKNLEDSANAILDEQIF